MRFNISCTYQYIPQVSSTETGIVYGNIVYDTGESKGKDDNNKDAQNMVSLREREAGGAREFSVCVSVSRVTMCVRACVYLHSIYLHVYPLIKN